MAAEKTTGIVLRVIPFSETSCIVTLFTREFGKITMMAKGARRPKSPFEAALDVLAICRIVFLDKSSGAMGLLTEAKLERRFRSATRNLNQLYSGYYVVELLSTLNDEGDPHHDLFDYAVATIGQIDSTETREDQLGRILLRFELKALELLGHLPMLTKCVSCGRAKTTLTGVSFGLNLGGILCQTCRRGESNIVGLSSDGLRYLLGLVGGQIGTEQNNSDNWNQPDRETENLSASDGADTPGAVAQEVRENKIEQRELSQRVSAQETSQIESRTEDVIDQTKSLNEIRHLMHKYITHLLGFPPKLHKFLKNF
jgi:DNA repair protein RecO (recombination protein O)